MRRLLLPVILAILPLAAHAQLQPPAKINCIQDTSTPCSSTAHIGNGSQGDPLWLVGGKINDWGLQLGLFSNSPANYVLATPSGAPGIPSLRALVASDIPPINLAGTGNGGVFGQLDLTLNVKNVLPIANGGTGTATPGIVAGTNVTVTGSWPNQTINATGSGGSLPSCTTNQLLYYASAGTTGTCLTLGTNLSIATGTLNATAGGGGVSSFTGDGSLVTNSGSTGGVTLTLGNTGVGYGVWGNTGATSAAPGYNALSSYPAAAFPTLNQNTTGTAANITGTSNSTLTTLSALSLPAGQVTGLGALATVTPGTGVATFLTTPTATNLGTAVTGASLVAGTNVTITGTWPNQTITASATGATAFSALTGATNTTAAMVVGTGASLSTSGSGTIAATSLTGSVSLANTPLTTLGDLLYVNATPALARLAGYTTANTAVLTQTGTGAVSAAPAWSNAPALSAANMTSFPTLNQNTTGTAANITATSNATLTTLSALSLPSTQVTGLGALATVTPGTGVATFLATPSSANFAAAVTGETGTGAVVFGTSPTLVTPVLGTPTSVTLTNATGLPPTTGIVGWPANASGVLTNNGTGTLTWGSAGSGTVTDGAGTTTANEVAVSTSTAHVLGYAATLPTAAMPALTGDVTNTAGSLATTVGKVNGGSVPASANCVGTNSSSQFTAGCAEAVNAQVGTTYTVATTDCGGQITFNNAASIAVTVPQATSSFATCQFDVTDIGAGTATLTPTTSTINGSASLAVAQNRQCTVNSDGTNWQVIGCTALVSGGGGSGTVNSGTAGQLAYYAGTGTAVSGATNASISAGALTLGASGTAGSVTLGNATSGLLTIAPPTGALGTVTVTPPDATTTLAGLSVGQSWTAAQVFSSNVTVSSTPVASSSAFTISSSPFTGGDGTTTRPLEYLKQGATNVADFNTAGTEFGVNAPSGFTGNMLDFHVNGATSVAKLDYLGNLTVASCTGCGAGGSTNFQTNAVALTSSTTVNFENSAATNGLTLTFANPSAGNVQLGLSGSLALTGLATQAGDTIVANATGSTASPTAVSVSAFQMALLQASTKFTAAGTGCTVGTTTGGATAGTFVLAAGPCTSVVLTMNGATGLTAPNGWHCDVGDRTLQNAGTWWGEWPESSSTTTTATIAIPAAAGATDTISFHCSGF